ncbi:hypothetical protein pb186bvf_006228 [Paramecium bursaria]
MKKQDSLKNFDSLNNGLASENQRFMLVKYGSLLKDLNVTGNKYVCFGDSCQLVQQELTEEQRKARHFIQIEKIEDAIPIIDISINLHPQDYYNYFLKGECLSRLGQTEEALQCYDKSIELNDKNCDAYLSKGFILMTQGNLQQAYQEIKKSLDQNRKQPQALNALGNIHYLQSQLDDAIILWKEVLEVDDENAQAFNNIGLAMVEQGQQKDAIDFFHKAIKINSNNPLFYCNRGIALLGIDQEDALEDFLKAQELIKDPLNKMKLTKNNYEFVEDRITTIQEIEENKRQLRDLMSKLNMNKDTKEKMTKNLDNVEQKSQEVYMKGIIKAKDQQIDDLELQINDIKKALEVGGYWKKYQMKLELDKLEQEGGIEGNLQKEYYCTFYWTLLEYLTAYQQLSLQVFQAGPNAKFFDKPQEDGTKQLLIEYGAKFIGSQVKKLAEKVPIVGNILEYLDGTLDSILNTRKENIFQKKIQAINDIIRYKKGETFMSFDDLSLSIQEAAFTLSVKQKDDIVKRVNSKQIVIGQPLQPTQAWQDFLKALQDFKDKVMAKNKDDMFQGTLIINNQVRQVKWHQKMFYLFQFTSLINTKQFAVLLQD